MFSKKYNYYGPKNKKQDYLDFAKKIRAHQRNAHVHPLTCGVSSLHEDLVPRATACGQNVLVCPSCGYVQIVKNREESYAILASEATKAALNCQYEIAMQKHADAQLVAPSEKMADFHEQEAEFYRTCQKDKPKMFMTFDFKGLESAEDGNTTWYGGIILVRVVLNGKILLKDVNGCGNDRSSNFYGSLEEEITKYFGIDDTVLGEVDPWPLSDGVDCRIFLKGGKLVCEPLEFVEE